MIIKTLNQERDIKIIKLHKKLVGDDLEWCVFKMPVFNLCKF
jgi:hypothetical protein